MNVKLQDIASLQIGYQFRQKPTAAPFAAFRVIHIKDFDSERNLRVDSLDRYAIEGEPSRYMVQAGDVLFLARGVRLFAYALKFDLPDTLAAGHFFIIRPNSPGEVLTEYLAWCLNHTPGLQFLAGGAVQRTHMPYVPVERFRNFELPLPSIATQRRIVELERLQHEERLLMRRIETLRANMIEAAALSALQQDSR